MASSIQRRRGTTSDHSTFTGAVGEITIDTTKDTVVVHDGAVVGGVPLLREDLGNLPAGAVGDAKLATITTAGKVSNSATTAASANTPSAIVARDGSGNFTAGTITAALTGAASSNVLKAGDTMTGALVVPLASASTPSLTFTGDLNTGIYSPGEDQLAVATNGAPRLSIDASGNVSIDGTTFNVDAVNNRVGIGTSLPGQKLDVNGEIVCSPNTAGKNTFQFTTQAANDASLVMRANTTIKVNIQANGSSYFDGGNVGIGTTTPTNTDKLEIQTSSTSAPGLWVQTGGTTSAYPIADFRTGSNLSALLIRGDGASVFTGKVLVGTSSATGVNGNVAPVLAGNFMSFQGSVSASSGSATTLFALENLNATYIVTAVITGTANAAAYHSVYVVGSVVTNSHSIQALKAGSLLTLSLSGANVQATQSSGISQTITWSVTRMANL